MMCADKSSQMFNCNICNDTGWTGDNNAGLDGNSEVHACDCEQGKKIENAIRILGFDTVKDFVKTMSSIERVEKLEKKLDELQNVISDLSDFARLHDVSEYHDGLPSTKDSLNSRFILTKIKIY